MWILKSVVFPLVFLLLIVWKKPEKGVEVQLLITDSTQVIFDGDELILDGNYYDIISMHKTSKGTIYTCIDDRKETGYHHAIKEEQGSNETPKENKNKLKAMVVEFFDEIQYRSLFLRLTECVYNNGKQIMTYEYADALFIPPRLEA